MADETKNNSTKPAVELAKDVTAKVIGKKVVARGDAGRLYLQMPVIGMVFINKDHGLKAGEPIDGTCTAKQVLITTDEHGNPRADGDLIRWELVDYTPTSAALAALESDMEVALIKAKVKAIADMKFDPSMFFKASKEEVVAA